MSKAKELLKSFDSLKHGDLIISPIDNVVMMFFIDKDEEKYLTDGTSAWACIQFDAKDFYLYDGNKKQGEKDLDFFTEKRNV